MNRIIVPIKLNDVTSDIQLPDLARSVIAAAFEAKTTHRTNSF